jgi:anti-sigma factor RsiW
MSGQILRFDDSAHNAADAVLPWFVNGTLTGAELATVEQHLRECARCQREVDLLKQLQVVCTADEPVIDPTPSYRELSERIARAPRLGAVTDRLRGLSGHWQGVPTWARWAIAAQFVGILALALWLVAPLGEPGAIYQTLGAPGAPASRTGTVAVVFAPEVTEGELRRIVQSVGARVVDGPTASNAYVLEISTGSRDATLAALRAERGVVLAQPLTTKPDR